eukprot:gene63146-86379_t
MAKNITLAIDEDLLDKVRVLAAMKRTSVNELRKNAARTKRGKSFCGLWINLKAAWAIGDQVARKPIPGSRDLIGGADVFLDTNVLIYAALGREHAQQRFETARRIVLEEDYCTSSQVLAEFYVNVQKKGLRPISAELAEEWVRVI